MKKVLVLFAAIMVAVVGLGGGIALNRVIFDTTTAGAEFNDGTIAGLRSSDQSLGRDLYDLWIKDEGVIERFLDWRVDQIDNTLQSKVLENTEIRIRLVVDLSMLPNAQQLELENKKVVYIPQDNLVYCHQNASNEELESVLRMLY